MQHIIDSLRECFEFDIIEKKLEVLDILKKSIFVKEEHKKVFDSKGERFLMIHLSINGEKNINKIKDWLSDFDYGGIK